MKALRNWKKGVSVNKHGQISKPKKRKRYKVKKDIDICLNCKEKKCRGTCKNFKR